MKTSPMVYINGRLECSYIYFLTCAADSPEVAYIKIGISNRVINRFSALVAGCGLKPVSFAYFPAGPFRAGIKLERELHDAFAIWRTRGEWYRFEMKHKSLFNSIRKEIKRLLCFRSEEHTSEL